LLIVLLSAGVIAAMAAPLTAGVVEAGRIRHAAGFLSSRFRLARQEAIARSANVGVVFDIEDEGWRLRVCRDGTRNGLRRADVQSGVDPCFDGPYALDELFPSVTIAVDPALRGPGGEPGSADPVRFGSADIVSFSPLGSCTAGSVFLRSRSGQQFTVRVGGLTSRIRVLWYEPAQSAWRER
jgi:hypothetical protein